MLDAFKYGFQTGMRQWRIAMIVYLLQLCLAFTVGMQVYEVLQASIGNSLEINKLLKGYDHTVITDFLKVHGASITPLIGQLRWLLVVWLFFSVFVDAGLLYCSVRPNLASWKTFWQSGAEYFSAFLKLSLLFLTLALIWTALIFIPLALFLEPALECFSSEQYPVWLVLLLLAIWLMGLALLFVWSTLSRLLRLQSGVSTFRAAKNGWLAFNKTKARFTSLLVGFIALQIILLAIYLHFEAYSGMTSPLLILVFFILQQTFVFSRIQIRQMLYAGIGHLLSPEAKPALL